MKAPRRRRPETLEPSIISLRVRPDVHDVLCQASELTGRSVHALALSGLHVAARQLQRMIARRRACKSTLRKA